jgi:hypothetical protein
MALATAPNGQAQAAPPIPFSKAALRKRGQMTNQAVNAALGGQWNPQINSQGYMAKIRLLFTLIDTVAVAANTAQALDYPWNIINRYMLMDSLGNNLHNLKGYSAMLAARYFQPRIGRNPASQYFPDGNSIAAAAPDARLFVATLTGGTAALPQVFSLDLPVETDVVQHIGLVPNQNASFNYFMNITMENSGAALFTIGAGSTNAWAGAITPVYEYYTVPQPVRGDGRPQMTMPPYAGVIRQLRDEVQQVPGAAGTEQRYNFTPGMVIRGFCLVARDASGVRVGSTLTSGITRVKIMYGDDTILGDWSVQDFVSEHFNRYGEPPPVGVYPFQWISDLAGIVGQSRSTDVLDTRELAQFYLLVTCGATGNPVSTIDIVHDDLIVPRTMSI